MRDDLKREFVIRPAYDKRDGKGGGSQHCADFLFLLKGKLGAVQFLLYTGWSARIIPPPKTDWRDLYVPHKAEGIMWEPMPADLGYHSPLPRYTEQTSMGMCEVLGGKECYYDGSSLNANRIFSVMIHEGGERMWEELEKYYAEIFEAVVVPTR